MSLLAPLGLLGLLGIIALIIIYLIKPNYQNKIVSSTFIWKLSLKYRKKKIPINTLRNIILFICQVLIISLIASMLAQPIIAKEEEPREKVLIIDASASMMTSTAGSTRFERSLGAAEQTALELVDDGGIVSVIIAHDKASFLVQQADASAREAIVEAFDGLTDPASGNPCTFGTPDIEGAVKLSERITQTTAGVEVILYSDTAYINSGRIKVVSPADESEWNAAILDVRAIVDENFYRFEIDVASYGIDRDLKVYCTVSGINEDKSNLDLVADVRCDNDQKQTLIFGTNEELSAEVVEVFSYESVYVHLNEQDSIDYDNSFYLYGGAKPTLKIQYYSANPNNYFGSMLMVLREQLGYRWDIEIDEVKRDEVPEVSGYDLYIYEHAIPSTLPNDGVVILSNPDAIPASAGIRLGSTLGFAREQALEAGDAHPITDGISVENIHVTRYTKVTSYDGYTPLAYCGADPVILAKNEPDQKIVVMSFSHNFSDLAVLLEFPMMMYNLLEYYIPSTLSEYVFNVNDTLSLNARAPELYVTGPYTEVVYDQFPGELKVTAPGVYTTVQTTISGEDVVDAFFVKVPEEESNINLTEDVLSNPFYFETDTIEDVDILIYFAIALVALLFCEWWLQTREQF